MLTLPGVRERRLSLGSLGTEETKQARCEHEREGETDATYATSRTFSRTFSSTYSTPRHLAHQRYGPTSALASSAGRLSGWPLVGSSRSRGGSGRDKTLAPILISQRSTPVCHRTGGPVVGCWTSHLCHTVEPAGSRLLVCPTPGNNWGLWVEWDTSTADVCRSWHHHCPSHEPA